METLKFDLMRTPVKFKPLNAVNNGPAYQFHRNDQLRSNLDTYREARIPYARNHDAAFCPTYGGSHTVDITAIFPNFDADVRDGNSYDFAVTDAYLLSTAKSGTETYYRLGQKIEHEVKKYGTIPPKDFGKWAEICEHIIMHYNEGWSNGYKLGLTYWEIWNEPDLDIHSDNKRTWGGTPEEFFDMYAVAAKHLKSRFPGLKIGGPALAGNIGWADSFLSEMRRRDVPIDFFSWHIYASEPCEIQNMAERMHELLVKYGYEGAESHLNEWNYVKDWTDGYVDSIKTIIGMKGAAFSMACMSVAQQTYIDMMMYYDARPNSLFNGLFDFYTLKPLKGYYPFYWYGGFYDSVGCIPSENRLENIYSLCGVDRLRKATAVITYYTDKSGMPDREVAVDFGRKNGKYELYLLDEEHDAVFVGETSDLKLSIKPNTCVMVREL